MNNNTTTPYPQGPRSTVEFDHSLLGLGRYLSSPSPTQGATGGAGGGGSGGGGQQYGGQATFMNGPQQAASNGTTIHGHGGIYGAGGTMSGMAGGASTGAGSASYGAFGGGGSAASQSPSGFRSSSGGIGGVASSYGAANGTGGGASQTGSTASGPSGGSVDARGSLGSVAPGTAPLPPQPAGPAAPGTSFKEWSLLIRQWRLIAALFWFCLVFLGFLFISQRPINFLTGLASSFSASMSPPQTLFQQYLREQNALDNPSSFRDSARGVTPNSFIQSTLFAFTFTASQLSSVYAHHLLLSASKRPLKQRKVLWFMLSSLVSCVTGVALASQFFEFLPLSSPSHYRASTETLPVTTIGFLLAAQLALLSLVNKDYIMVLPQVQQPRFFRFKAELPRIVVSSLGSAVLNSVLISIYQLYEGGSIAAFVQAFSASFAVALAWNLGHSLVHINHTQHIPFESRMGNTRRNFFLPEGLKNDSAILRSHAFQDLYLLSLYDPLRRKALFQDETFRSWTLVADSCLHRIDSITNRLTPVPKPTNQAPSIPKTKSRFSQLHEELNALLDRILKRELVGSFDVYGQPQLDREMKAEFICSSNAILGLAQLVAASKREDRIGVVQLSGTFTRSFNSLLSLFGAIEAKRTNAFTKAELYSLRIVVRSAIYKLVDTFYDSLKDYRDCPTHLAPIMQSFVDFAI